MELPRIIVKNVTKSFEINKKGFSDLFRHKPPKRLVALDDISFTVSKGEVVSIIGANGSGKTTLLRIIAGVYQPSSGTVQVNGRLAPILHIGTGFNNELGAYDNIVISGMLLGLPKKDISQRIKSVLEFADLEEFSDMRLKHYSYGMRARLAFSTAMQIDPDILLLDEILSVGDRAFKKKSQDVFLSYKEKGKTILFTSHSREPHLKVSNRVILLDKGKIVMIGKPEEVLERYQEIRDKKKAKID